MNQPADNNPIFTIKGQYVKDLSFENPQAPKSLLPQQERPKIDINIDLKAKKLQDDLFELVMNIGAKALSGDDPLFLVELAYCGMFGMQNMPQEKIEPILFVDCPFVLFPFARRVIGDVTRDGGFPPLMLEPIDFHRLYKEKQMKLQNA